MAGNNQPGKRTCATFRPASVHQKEVALIFTAAKLNRAVAALENRLDRAPTEKEIAKKMGISPNELRKVIYESDITETLSLSKIVVPAASACETDILGSDVVRDSWARSPSDRSENQEWWSQILRGCDKQERIIILLYYREGLTMKAIGIHVGLSESRVSQMHSQVIARLKNLREKSDFADIHKAA